MTESGSPCGLAAGAKVSVKVSALGHDGTGAALATWADAAGT